MDRNYNLPPGVTIDDVDPPENPESDEDRRIQAEEHKADVQNDK